VQYKDDVGNLSEKNKKSNPFLSIDASNIKLFVTDIDGTLTNGNLYYAGLEIMKQFNVHDGYGGKLLLEKGVAVAVLSGRKDGSSVARVNDLGWDIVGLGVDDKLKILSSYLKEKKINFSQVVYLGDDLNDLECIQSSGLGCCVADSQALLKKESDFILSKRGGEGAFRELVDLFLNCL
tara:strand:- start:9613 stop:10149 length:537 start_codon:yes stop_codon:yes gene_type:complete